MCVLCAPEALSCVAGAVLVTNPQANAIALIERSRDTAKALLHDATDYAAKQLRRHIDAMNDQISVYNGTKVYDRKKKR